MASDQAFEGWCGLAPDAAQGKMVWQGYEPKPFEDQDVDIEIDCCGICGSDVHVLRSGWGATDYPVVVGHEIVGKAIRVGKEVKSGIKVGDRVGVGAQAGSCHRGDCDECQHDDEQYCKNNFVMTYGAKWPSGHKAMGGYAKYWRGDGHFVFAIPEEIPSEEAAPMLCGGVTVYAPLKQNGVGPGKRVGIIGIGGLGHMGLMFARALGADKVVAISRTSEKKDDAIKMGADDLIATGEEGWNTKHKNSLDVIVSTVSSPKLPLMGYLDLLDVGGTFVQVGAPDDPIPGFLAFALIMKKVKITGSLIGSPKEIREMFELAAKMKVKPWIQKRPMSEANQAVVDFEDGKPRYRYVLTNPKKE
ncbi:NADP-dependent alcohol dehydrogenase 6 [Pseudocercospora fuligena]|uniref:alcohol dehydrogenase (NADP(+)) n=1 Tax=Pseudocercospora fuligena TaxID=685502 RepID=A0A8H6VN10_9PEZI|nr:NADP-dependent alcohol dehydrogenase 6 [Pseudocercospora fuligena]